MVTYFQNLPALPLFFLVLVLPCANSIHFKISSFEANATNMLYYGDAVPSGGTIELTNKYNFFCRVGWATYAKNVPLYHSRKLADFTTHFSFTIDTLGSSIYGNGFTFFLAPVGFQIPPNSAGGFLGLFNTTTMNSSPAQIVLVEFDSVSNSEWDPPFTHVGINNNSIASAVYTPWNASFHSGDKANVWISYKSASKNLSVHWVYQRTSNPQESSGLSYQIDLAKTLPQWVTVGFSAASGQLVERHTLHSWEFNSNLDVKEQVGNNNTAKKGRLMVVLITVSIGVFLAGMIIISFSILWKWKRKKRETTETFNLLSIDDDLERGTGPRRFSYIDLASATSNFSEAMRLGEGGFGAVYRGQLAALDAAVAVKKISKGSKQGRKEYKTEVKIISQLRHRNLVQLIGWCHEEGELLLVYEFMSNGSLDCHLFGNRDPLPWGVRFKISLGLASALLYLHEECEQCVVHRDIKSSNIMLDSSFNAKLGDFGLARLMDHGLGPEKTMLVGTSGYLAPEYVSTGRASKESDIYSFGVVCLEIATGRKSESNSEMGLVEWVWNLYGKGDLLVGVDERLLDMILEEREIECLMIVGLWCAHPDWSMRPSISQAIQVLKFDAALPKLPTKLPLPVIHEPTPSVSSHETTKTASLEVGR